MVWVTVCVDLLFSAVRKKKGRNLMKEIRADPRGLIFYPE